MCQFRVNENKFQDLKKIYKSGNTIFYITTTNQGITNVIYTGLYTILDNSNSLGDGNLSDLIGTGVLNTTQLNDGIVPEIIDPPKEQEIAIVTRKKVPISTESGKTKKNK